MYRAFRWLAFTSVLLASGGAFSFAYAAVTPVLTLTAVGDGDNVKVRITGDPSVGITLDYTPADFTARQRALGSTDANGVFETTIKSSDYNLVAGTITDVRLKGSSGPEMESQYVPWPALGSASSNTTTTTTTNTSGIVLTPSSVTVAVGGTAGITVSGGNQPYAIFTAADSISSATITGPAATIYGLIAGSSKGSVCDSTTGKCAPFTVTVTSSAPPPVTPTPTLTTTSVTSPAAASIPSYTFTANLSYGSQGSDVLALQNLLNTLGYLTATPNGYYGTATQAAVTKFQTAHGLAQLGIVGPTTRAALNQIASGGAGASVAASTPTSAVSTASQLATPIASMSTAELRSLVSSLVSQLAQIANRLAALGG